MCDLHGATRRCEIPGPLLFCPPHGVPSVSGTLGPGAFAPSASHLDLPATDCPCAQGPTRARQGWGRWPACLPRCFPGLLPLAPVSEGAGLCRVGSGSQEGPLGLLRPTCAPRTAAGPKQTTMLPSADSPPRHQTPLPAFIGDMGRPGGWKTARRGKPQPQHCSCWGHGKQC